MCQKYKNNVYKDYSIFNLLKYYKMKKQQFFKLISTISGFYLKMYFIKAVNKLFVGLIMFIWWY